MTGLHKFSLKRCCFCFVIVAFCIVITNNSEAHGVPRPEIYSTLTSDTIPKTKNPVLGLMSSDSVAKNDSTPLVQKIDTFSLKYSKDTLDAPIKYEASDSGVLLVKEKKFLLYGKTKTVYKDVTLTAPMVELDQETNIVTAVNAKDSLGNVFAWA